MICGSIIDIFFYIYQRVKSNRTYEILADTVILQDRIDGFVLVVRSRHAPREAVLRAASLLKPGAVLGTVFNAQRQIIKPRYYG